MGYFYYNAPEADNAPSNIARITFFNIMNLR
jgi:hypothetical protein